MLVSLVSRDVIGARVVQAAKIPFREVAEAVFRPSFNSGLRKVDSVRARAAACNRHARSVARELRGERARAPARVYIGIFVAVYHFCACPPFYTPPWFI